VEYGDLRVLARVPKGVRPFAAVGRSRLAHAPSIGLAGAP
jgi:hypothetical protein